MWQKIRIIFTIPELRQKILLTLGLLAIYRIGYWIVLPIVDQQAMTDYFTDAGGMKALFAQISMFSGTQLSQVTIFGLGIMPYISASIIFQLLGTVYEPLEKLQKEGESGRKKINEYTRYATIAICLLQSSFYVGWVVRGGMVRESFLIDGQLSYMWLITSVVLMTTGTAFLMWLGEQIDEYGIGNGISLLIMAGILARLPSAIGQLVGPIIESGATLGGQPGQHGIETLFVLVILFVAVVAGVVFITKGQRRIRTESAKHVRGRRIMSGNRQFLPLRVNQAGVMPIIFASSLLLFPSVGFSALAQYTGWDFFLDLESVFQTGQTFTYNLLYIGLIFFFCYFWTAVTFNPKDMAENLKNYGTFIRGYRPGRRTAEFLEKVMIRITYVGAAFLALVAIVPTLISNAMQVDYSISSFFGGTGLLIAVSVAIDLVDKIDSHLVMRNYKGLLERTS
jgi:preprotein translocase subunit SecY